jgi:hypothetical protein
VPFVSVEHDGYMTATTSPDSAPVSSTPVTAVPESSSTTHSPEWEAVQESMKRLAMKLDYHWQQASSADKDEWAAAIDRLGKAVRGAVDGIRVASADEAVRADLHEVGTALEAALVNSLDKAGNELRERVDSVTKKSN